MEDPADDPLAYGPEPIEEERSLETSLRPRTLDEFIGQDRLKENLSVYIAAALERGEALDHILFHGPPGLGKTTLAHIISHALGVNIHPTAGPILEKPGDVVAVMTNLQARDVFFIDEIHRLPKVVEETLYPALEDRKVDVLLGQGPSARTIKLDLKPFTLIGATTRTGLLTSPLRDRFGVLLRLDYYTVADLEKIVTRSAKLLSVAVTHEGAHEIARRSRGTPRIANRYLRRVRDFAQIRRQGVIENTLATEALERMEIDALGLDPMDRKLLLTIIETFRGGPVGVDTLASALHEEKRTIEDIYEPYLIQIGFLDRTPRGRLATPQAYAHLGRKPPSPAQGPLFS
ncbi:MAG: Holliday junction branch migration DNA helicase RuvB [Nitrospirae bacterium]|nr:Holliday junction branch migration DNA helicase RuvB [Nitrospirota bacterium]